MSSVDPSSQSSTTGNGYSRWFGTGLGGDAITTEHERNTMTNRQLQEQFGRGTAAYAERSGARSEVRPAAPEVEYFKVNGLYMATDGIDIEPAQRAELDDIAQNGTVQDNGRVRFGYHADLAEADLVTMPTEQPARSALAAYVGSGNALADAVTRQAERDGHDR
ncbi:hypothetical protein BOX37_01470 [Nocardia mangyaensis]|uniref:Uncharacterized protein n=1 Tax=Nocardia mangyaensis TaxID=2213200 RepID=A0A1J0VLE7_9NOCA|nr:hypothetical protein [Nocardia mangyaensis]APE32857.1 hypothetical protein BOX37_01470 [Nocardia mangyaensis]